MVSRGEREGGREMQTDSRVATDKSFLTTLRVVRIFIRVSMAADELFNQLFALFPSAVFKEPHLLVT